jgi:hypothetical protein
MCDALIYNKTRYIVMNHKHLYFHMENDFDFLETIVCNIKPMNVGKTL